jgi:hypothetical protein
MVIFVKEKPPHRTKAARSMIADGMVAMCPAKQAGAAIAAPFLGLTWLPNYAIFRAIFCLGIGILSDSRNKDSDAGNGVGYRTR